MGSGWHKPATYVPVDPRAYVAQLDWRSNFWLFAVAAGFSGAVLWGVSTGRASPAAVLVLVFPGALAYVMAHNIRRGVVAIAVDQPGVFLGESTTHSDDTEHRLIPWNAVHAVELFEVWQPPSGSDSSGAWRSAVGVRADPALSPEPQDSQHAVGSGQTASNADQMYFRIINGWRLDRAALNAAVNRFAPDVPVVEAGARRDNSH
jgi:hypothetical protein